MSTVLIWLMTAIHIVIALIVIVLVLMQKSSDQGVGAAFGGGVTESVFGAGTTSALVRMTTWCAGILIGTTLILAVLHTHRGGSSHESLMQKAIQSAPAAPTAPASQPPSFPTITPPTSTGTTTPAAPASPAAEAKPAAESTPAPAPSPAKP